MSLLSILMMDCKVENKTDSNEEERIRMFYPNWISEFMETKDPNDYIKSITDDYVLMGCGFDPITSRDTIQSDLRKLVASDFKIKITDCQSHEIIIRDDIAIHRYTCFEVLTSKSDTIENKVAFNYLDILNKTSDNKWKIHLHLATVRQ
jgi:ketosteroid isomerase-like protein